MAKQYSRIHRLLKILTLVQSSPGWNAAKLAKQCEASPRTVYRDLQMLEAAGIPCKFDGQSRGYRVGSNFFMPPVDLTLDEALALVALASQVAGREQIPLLRPAARASNKIRSQLPLPIRESLEDVDRRLDIQLARAGDEDGTRDVYEKVRGAIASRQALRCSYEPPTSRRDGGAEESFLFKPYSLFFGQRAWYTVGHHSRRDALRSLKLNRFTSVISTQVSYEIPADFSMGGYLGNAWRMIRGEKSYRVELHFDAEFAETIADTRWHQTQEVQWQEDGSILLRCEVEGLDEIVWWVLSMGPHCLVKQPPELAQRVRDLARQVTARYATAGKD